MKLQWLFANFYLIFKKSKKKSIDTKCMRVINESEKEKRERTKSNEKNYDDKTEIFCVTR